MSWLGLSGTYKLSNCSRLWSLANNPLALEVARGCTGMVGCALASRLEG